MSEIDKPGDNGIVADRFRKRCFVRQLQREMAINPKPKLSSSKCRRRCTAAPTRWLKQMLCCSAWIRSWHFPPSRLWCLLATYPDIGSQRLGSIVCPFSLAARSSDA